MIKPLHYQDLKVNNQGFFSLGSIQSAAIGIPAMIFGGVIGSKYGAGVGLCSIFTGNLILWAVGLIIISMVSNERMNAIENIKEYLGKIGTIIAALFFVFVFLNWFALQISSTVFLLNKVWQFDTGVQNDMVIRLGAALGFFTSLLAIGGIRVLKWISIVSVLLLLLGGIYILSCSRHQPPFLGFGLSFFAVMTTVLSFLPGVINLPTFFRYSCSRADSCLGLTFMIVYYTFFECVGMWIDLNDLFATAVAGKAVILSLFLILLLLCINLLNIYLASACYETFIPRFVGTKGYAIMGLLGTASYTFIQISSSIQFLLDLLNSYLVSLCCVLLISFLFRIVSNRMPGKIEKWINTIAWLVGCLVSTILKIQNPANEMNFLLLGAGASAMFFLVVMYAEETFYSAKKIIFERFVR